MVWMISIFIALAPLLLLVQPTTSLVAAVTPPDFYSKLVSPLVENACDYAKQGVVVPKTLDEYGNNAHVATFAGGCFWGLELAYQREPGVLATCVGYTHGHEKFPAYKQVCNEETGHTEAVLLVYDPDEVSYARLADLLFDRIPDPTMLNRVGRDRGTQYRTGMYAHSDEQFSNAQIAFDRENRTWRTSGRPIVTEVKRAQTFWPAEELHQRYLEKGGCYNRPQSAEKGAAEEIRCYG